MITNYREALEHFYNSDFLNEKGIRELTRLTKQEIMEVREKISKLEAELQYMRKAP